MIAFIQVAHAAGEPTGVAMFSQLLLPIAFFALFYFLIIRPKASVISVLPNGTIDNVSTGA